MRCTDSSCIKCESNASQCLGCDTAKGFFLDGVTCSNQLTLPTGRGAVLSTGIVADCLDSLCGDCRSEVSKCSLCLTDHAFYKSKCVPKSAAIDGILGLDSTVHQWKPCAVSLCVNCVDNYQTCTECDTANGYTLVDNKCEKLPTLVNLTCSMPAAGSSSSTSKSAWLFEVAVDAGKEEAPIASMVWSVRLESTSAGSQAEATVGSCTQTSVNTSLQV